MSVVIETTLGDITVDLFLSERPTACMNFLKLCKLKYYNYNLFHTISRGFIAQTGDPTGSRTGGESLFGILNGPDKRYFQGENKPRIKHTKMGLISFVGNENFMLGSQFFLTLGEDLTYLDEKHCVFGEVVEGFDVLEVINEVICDGDDRPYQDVRITHTVILDDPFPDPEKFRAPSRSPSPSAERLMGGRIAPDEDINEMEGKNAAEVAELQADREAKARATILEMVGDIPDAEMAPPENVLFVCKLNPVTTDEDLEIIFNRFGKIKSCEVIRDRKTGDSLQYAFIEFEDQKSCEDAYFKMDNILIDDRRIHVDFSQSVSKIKWHGKGRGVTHFDESGKKIENGTEKNSEQANSFSGSKKSSSSNAKESNRGKERYDHKYSQKNNESYKHHKSHYNKRDDYSSDRSRNRRSYENNYSSLERDRSRHEYNKKNEMEYKRKQEKYNTQRERNERNHYEEISRKRSSRDRDTSRQPEKRRYSTEQEKSANKIYNKKQMKYEKHKMIDEKLEKKSNRGSSSRKKRTRSVSCSSRSESSDSVYDKKKRKAQKQRKKKEHISDESSDDAMCKKKKKKVTKKKHITSSSSSSTSSTTSSSSETENERFKNRTNKKKTRRDKSSESDSNRKRKKK